jgi:ATP-binding cassette subfamily B protein/subfamily B ATP-binding cassette protein MsbA
MLMFGMLGFGIFAALFEGGTLAILGAAVAALTADAPQGLDKMPGAFDLSEIGGFEGLSTGGWFLLLVSVAVGMQVIKSVMTYLSTVIQVKLTYGLQRFVQGAVIHDIMARSYVQIGSFPAGYLAGLVEQSGSLADLVTISGKTVRAICMLLIYGLTMLYLSWLMTGIALIIFVSLWWSLTKLVYRIRGFAETAASEQIKTWRNTIEFLNAPRLLRILNTEKEAETVIEAARKRWIRAEKKAAVLIAAIIPSFEAITVIGAGVFLVVSYLFSGESANELVPKLFVFVLVFFRLKPQVQMLNDARLQFVKLLPKIENTGKFLGAEDRQCPPGEGKKVDRFERRIKFDDVTFSYPDTAVNTLEEVTFSVDKGEMVALVGESGAGKSTIVNLLLGLYRPDAGGILVDEQNLNEVDLASWRSQLGVVDQDVFLLNATVSRNINFGREAATQADVEEAAKLAFAHDFIVDLPDGYQTTIGDRGYRLSGGQKQRLAIARAILHNPDILILDEATSALDSISEKAVQQSLSEMHRHRTMLVIAHRLTTIEQADKIIVIEHGKVLEVGSRAELMKIEGGRYRSFLLA